MLAALAELDMEGLDMEGLDMEGLDMEGLDIGSDADELGAELAGAEPADVDVPQAANESGRTTTAASAARRCDRLMWIDIGLFSWVGIGARWAFGRLSCDDQALDRQPWFGISGLGGLVRAMINTVLLINQPVRPPR